MRRIEANASVEELQARFQAGVSDPETLREILERLSGRHSLRASDLRGKVIARLSQLHAPIPETASQTEQTPHAIMRPLGAPGLPPPIATRVGRRTDLPLKHNATQAQKYIAALQALIAELKASSKRRSRPLTNGRQLPGAGQTILYSFELEDSSTLIDDSNVQLEVRGERHDAVIASARPGGVLISTAAELGPEVPRARLLLDDTALLTQLCERIGDIGKNFLFNPTLADAVVDKTARLAMIPALKDSASKAQLDSSQTRARESVRTQSLTYIWGPPGCGKTYTLAEIVRMAFVADQRILICSNTNKAVDQVLHGVCKQLRVEHAAALKAGKVIRLGHIVDDLLQADFADAISADAVAERLAQELRARISEKNVQLELIVTQRRAVREWVARFDELDRKKRSAADLSHAFQTLTTKCARIESTMHVQRTSLTQLHEELRRAGGLLTRLFQRPKERIDADIRLTEAELRKLHSDLAEARQRRELPNEQQRELEHECRQLAAELAHIDEAQQRRDFARLEGAERTLYDEIQELEKQISQLHTEVIRNARILGVTGTRAYLSVRDISPMDLVIIDEASMLPLPVVWFIAGIASARVVVCGDFRQLPPIIGTDNPAIDELVGADVFNAAGVSRLDPNDRRIVMLDTQRRMQPAICNLISGPMYAGRLRTFDGADFWARRNAQPKPPEPLSATLTIVDTSHLHPIESVDTNHSRFNLLHALVTRNIASLMKQRGYLIDAKRLAIITPYRAQVNLTRTLLADAEIEDVQVGTVHAFQGDERHTIVVDIPESEGATGQPGQLIRGPAPDDIGARLTNVAVSRAQNHLIVVANLAYLDRVLPASSLLRSVLWVMQTEGSVVQAQELLPLGPVELDGLDGADIKARARKYGLFDQADFDAALAIDVGQARHSIAIFSGFIGTRRTNEWADALEARVQSGVRTRCVTRPPHSNLPNTSVGKAALDKLEAIGCVVDCRKRIHQKVVIIDGHIVWHGSLNALSYSQYADELMTRTLGRGFAQTVAALLAKKRVPPEKVLDVITDAENPRCGHCDGSVRTFIDRRAYVEEFICENFCGWSEPVSGERPSSTPRPITIAPESTEAGAPVCSVCGAPMVQKQGPYGPFPGCPNYPRCKGKPRGATR